MRHLFQFAFLLALLVYLVFAGSIGVKALIHRQKGWVSAVVFSLMLLTLPLWIRLMYNVFLLISGQE